MTKKLLLNLTGLLLSVLLVHNLWAGTSVDYNDANCQGAWLFTEGSGTTVADASQNSNSGTFLGSGQPEWHTTLFPLVMTANNAPVPYIVSASSEFNVNFAAWYAFDNNEATYWVTAATSSGWLKVDVGDKNIIIVATYNIECNTVPEPNRMPKDWTLQGSNNDSDWDTLDTVTGETSWGSGEKRTYTCDVATTAYRYFKLDITDNNGDTYLIAASFELIASSMKGQVKYAIGDYISIDDFTGSESTFSITSWLLPFNFGSYRAIFSKVDVNYPDPFDIYLIQTTGLINFHFGDGGSTVGTNFGNIVSTNAVSISAWSHIATVCKSGTAADNEIYINGVKETNSIENNFTGSFADHASTAYLGYRPDGLAMSGRQAETAYFNDIITSTEINDIMDNGLAPVVAAGAPQVIMIQ